MKIRSQLGMRLRLVPTVFKHFGTWLRRGGDLTIIAQNKGPPFGNPSVYCTLKREGVTSFQKVKS